MHEWMRQGDLARHHAPLLHTDGGKQPLGRLFATLGDLHQERMQRREDVGLFLAPPTGCGVRSGAQPAPRLIASARRPAPDYGSGAFLIMVKMQVIGM